MPQFKSTIDLSKAVGNITDGAEHGIKLAVEHVLTEANKSVPHDEGTLERSGATGVDGTRGSISYDTPYAVRQHEDMSLSHDGKGQSKWLENTLAQEADAVGKIIATTIKHEAGT